MEFSLLKRDEDFVVIEKPESFHVHPPEDPRLFVDPQLVVLSQLRRQLGTRVFPVHRLDAATSGCLLFALNPAAASALGASLRGGNFRKQYLAVARGWTPPEQIISIPLESEDKSRLLEAESRLRTLGTVEHAAPVGIRHPTARYSLVELEPVTGRYHQLRRHLNRVSHPIVGDVAHGDRHHNRYFREKLGIPGLCLRAERLAFPHPHRSDECVEVCAPLPPKWERILELFPKP